MVSEGGAPLGRLFTWGFEKDGVRGAGCGVREGGGLRPQFFYMGGWAALG